MNDKIRPLIALFSIATTLLVSCAGEQTNNSETTGESSHRQEEDTLADQTTETNEVAIDTSLIGYDVFRGYIGDAKVTVAVKFGDYTDPVEGFYYYDKYKKNIPLNGEEVDWYGGPIYELTEADEKGNTTGTWKSLHYGFMDTWDGYFVSADSTYSDILLIPEGSSTYIHPATKMLFRDEAHAEHFFAIHGFLHEETVDKQGLIVNNDDGYDYQLLPEGLTVYGHDGHDGSDGFGVEAYGHISSDNTIEFSNGEKMDLDDYCDYDMTSIGYEIYAIRFDEMITSEYVHIVGMEYDEMYFSVDELESYDFHLEGDGYWLKRESGSVLGYFPGYYLEGDDYFNHKITVFNDQSTDNPILEVTSDADGFFDVNDVVYHDDLYWVNVTFDYFEQVPCTDEIREDQPSVTGWIKLYGKGNGYYGGLVLDFYSKGC